jgi:predicted enzyme related to lactoylglutathione lyase
MEHLANWIEIPAVDLERAKKFYGKIFDAKLNDVKIGDTAYAIFRVVDSFNCGALACGSYYKPSQDGVLVYLNGGNDLSQVLARVETAGGKVLVEKTFLSDEAGYFGLFVDTEGNRMGLQSMS